MLDDTVVLLRGAESLLNGAIGHVFGIAKTTASPPKAESSVGTQLNETKKQVDEVRELVAEVKYFTRDVSYTTEEVIHDVLEPLPRQLEEAHEMVLAMSQRPWLETVPALRMAYLSMIHVALALVGLALLNV